MPAPRRSALYRLAWGFYLLLAIGGIVWIGSRRGAIEPALFVDPSEWWIDLGLGVGTGGLLLGCWEVARRRLRAARKLERRLSELLGATDATELASLAVLSGFAEEVFFRGAVQGAWGWPAATVLFALLHTGPGPAYRIWTLFAAVAGLSLAGLVEWRGTLLAAIVAHVVVNGVNLRRLGASARARATRKEPDGNAADGGERLRERHGALVDSAAWPGRRISTMQSDSRDVLDRVDREKEGYLEELKEYLRIPSISTDSAYAAEVRRSAEFLLEKMHASGLEAELVETDGHPLVYGEWTGAGDEAPTVLFYGHYDVQPPDPLEEWRNPPFEPTVEDDCLVARGATDDKGQSFAQLKAVAALLAERGSVPVNVKFIVEGEEESGGEAIEEFVRKDGGKRLACDAVVISDSSMFAPGLPSLLYGLKGLAYMEIRVTGPNRDLHSGTFGGAVANPANALASIIARLHDCETGKVSIPGFYDTVRPLEEWERTEFAKLPFDEGEYAAELGIEAGFGEEGYTTLERSWARPTCDVNGLWSGYQGEGAKTVLPARAGAKVSMRLVPDQDPKTIGELFTRYVHEIAPPGVKVEVRALHGAQAVLIDTSGPLAEAAMAAQEDVWGRPPVRVREGGSIPIVATFAEVLEVPILLMGFGLPDDRLHSPNEKFNISHFYNGIRTVVRFLDRAAGAAAAD